MGRLSTRKEAGPFSSIRDAFENKFVGSYKEDLSRCYKAETINLMEKESFWIVACLPVAGVELGGEGDILQRREEKSYFHSQNLWSRWIFISLATAFIF